MYIYVLALFFTFNPPVWMMW